MCEGTHRTVIYKRYNWRATKRYKKQENALANHWRDSFAVNRKVGDDGSVVAWRHVFDRLVSKKRCTQMIFILGVQESKIYI